MTILPVGAELFDVVKRIEVMKFAILFASFVKGPKSSGSRKFSKTIYVYQNVPAENIIVALYCEVNSVKNTTIKLRGFSP